MTTEISEMYCTKCGKKGIPIPRKNGKFKKSGHLKKLYCVYCGAEENHVEIRPIYDGDYKYEDFKFEMRYGNFDLEGNRKEPLKIFRSDLRKRGVI